MHFIFPFSWEFNHPNWRTHIFQRGRSTTNIHQPVLICCWSSTTMFIHVPSLSWREHLQQPFFFWTIERCFPVYSFFPYINPLISFEIQSIHYILTCLYPNYSPMVFVWIYSPQNDPNVGKYSRHGSKNGIQHVWEFQQSKSCHFIRLSPCFMITI